MTRHFLRLLALLALLLPLHIASAQPLPDVDTIIARHIEARGGADAIRAIRSLVFSEGTYEEGDYRSDGDSVMMLMRPYFKLVGHPERDPDYMEGYDGAAWEWFADPGLVVRTVGAASEAIRHGADVEGPYLDYREKGSTAELLGSEVIDGRPAYRIRLTMRDGYSTESFFDEETYLIVAGRQSAPVHAFGAEVSSEARVGDYREVAGVLFAHRFEEVEIATGRSMHSMHWGRIDANVDIPVEWFSPPEFDRTRIQRFMEQLYWQRSDAEALLWTYHLFRRAFPEEDTRIAAEVIGYQALKMGDIGPAIALLERNAADYPGSADSAFGLGRAYATAGRPAEARTEFERALAIEPGHSRAVRALAALEE